jgi:hypothetical protein
LAGIVTINSLPLSFPLWHLVQVSELFVLSVTYSLRQLSRFETVWNASIRHTTAMDVIKGSQGAHTGGIQKVIMVLLVLFEGCIIANTFLAHWDPISEEW